MSGNLPDGCIWSSDADYYEWLNPGTEEKEIECECGAILTNAGCPRCDSEPEYSDDELAAIEQEEAHG